MEAPLVKCNDPSPKTLWLLIERATFVVSFAFLTIAFAKVSIDVVCGGKENVRDHAGREAPIREILPKFVPYDIDMECSVYYEKDREAEPQQRQRTWLYVLRTLQDGNFQLRIVSRKKVISHFHNN